MAKEDFCFIYYDGDAARDKAHMNRLERGAYDDLISAQRKRGHLSMEDIKKVLSSDFEKCWGSLSWIVINDETGKYFIEWVDKSIEKMRRQSEKQKETANKRWKKEEKSDATALPRHTNGNTSPMPFKEDGNGNGNGNEDENLGKSENPLDEGLLIPSMLKTWKKYKPEYPFVQAEDLPALGKIAKFISDQLQIQYNPKDSNVFDKILWEWEVMSEFISKTDLINTHSLSQVWKYRQTIIQKIQNHGTTSKQPTSKKDQQQRARDHLRKVGKNEFAAATREANN